MADDWHLGVDDFIGRFDADGETAGREIAACFVGCNDREARL